MNHRFLIVLLSFFLFHSCQAQNQQDTCNCPKTYDVWTQADTVFHLSNGKNIVLCGHRNTDPPETTFSEFVLSVCGQDTPIDFWSAVLNCRIHVEQDTLFVEQLENLPTGKNFAFQPTVWTTEKIYFRGNNFVREEVLNRQIRNYEPNEIQAVLGAFETAVPELNDSTMLIAERLFIASISGDQTARKYFHDFENRFGQLDGAYAEEYRDLKAMLVLWGKTSSSEHVVLRELRRTVKAIDSSWTVEIDTASKYEHMALVSGTSVGSVKLKKKEDVIEYYVYWPTGDNLKQEILYYHSLASCALGFGVDYKHDILEVNGYLLFLPMYPCWTSGYSQDGKGLIGQLVSKFPAAE